jgi:transposase
MPPPLTIAHKNRIEQHIHSGLAVKFIAEAEDVSLKTVYRIIDNLLAFGTHTAPRVTKLGRPLAIFPAARVGLRAFVESKPWAYQDEMQYELFDSFDLIVSQSTISKTLHAMKISRKSLRRVASERSQLCRDTYFLAVSDFTHDQLVFLDESAANEHIMWRKRGYSDFGIRPTISVPVKRSKRHSVLPAYCSDGILCYHIHQGSIDGARFEWFLKNEILPRCNSFPGPKSVLIMDNCSTHHGAEVKRLCGARGILLLYLPPYSPDFNPIEEFFSVLKAWLKRHFELAEDMPFRRYLELAVQACSGGTHAKAHFAHAGISVGEYEVEEEELYVEDEGYSSVEE